MVWVLHSAFGRKTNLRSTNFDGDKQTGWHSLGCSFCRSNRLSFHSIGCITSIWCSCWGDRDTRCLPITCSSIVPLSVGPKDLASANATIEIPRTLVSFGVPLAVGIFIAEWMMSWVFLTGALAAAFAFLMALRLPNFEKTVPSHDGILRRLKEGGGYVLKNRLLRAISLCAIFWNMDSQTI